MSLSSEPSTALHSKYFPLSPSLEHGANIVCTIGMHSTKESVVKKMIANGMNVARINMTHAKHADVIKIVDFIREEAARQGKEVRIMIDLKGPEIRNIFDNQDNEIYLEIDQEFTLTADAPIYTHDSTQVSFPGFFKDVKEGQLVHLEGGDAGILRIEKLRDDFATCIVVKAGLLTNMRHITVQGMNPSLDTITEKDEDDIAFGAKIKADIFATSFVRSPDDIHKLNRIIAAASNNPYYHEICAKIENYVGYKNFIEIMQVVHVTMIARGDLGFDLGLAKLVIAQEIMARYGHENGHAVLLATGIVKGLENKNILAISEADSIMKAMRQNIGSLMSSEATTKSKTPWDAVKALKSHSISGANYWQSELPYEKRLVM